MKPHDRAHAGGGHGIGGLEVRKNIECTLAWKAERLQARSWPVVWDPTSQLVIAVPIDAVGHSDKPIPRVLDAHQLLWRKQHEGTLQDETAHVLLSLSHSTGTLDLLMPRP